MINKKEIKKIAALAKIDISDDEMGNYSEQISRILEYMSTLEEVDTSNIEEFHRGNSWDLKYPRVTKSKNCNISSVAQNLRVA